NQARPGFVRRRCSPWGRKCPIAAHRSRSRTRLKRLTPGSGRTGAAGFITGSGANLSEQRTLFAFSPALADRVIERTGVFLDGRDRGFVAVRELDIEMRAIGHFVRSAQGVAVA